MHNSNTIATGEEVVQLFMRQLNKMTSWDILAAFASATDQFQKNSEVPFALTQNLVRYAAQIAHESHEALASRFISYSRVLKAMATNTESTQVISTAKWRIAKVEGYSQCLNPEMETLCKRIWMYAEPGKNITSDSWQRHGIAFLSKSSVYLPSPDHLLALLIFMFTMDVLAGQTGELLPSPSIPDMNNWVLHSLDKLSNLMEAKIRHAAAYYQSVDPEAIFNDTIATM